MLLISAYFVPGEQDTKYFVSLAKRGVKVRVLTNSLAATDEPLVHAGYVHFRRELVEGGVEVYELRPQIPNQPPSHGASSGVSLHAKCIVVDAIAEVHRLDEHGSALETAQHRNGRGGVQSRAWARRSIEYFDRAARPVNAYRVSVDAHGSLQWESTDEQGNPQVVGHEPEASMARRSK